MTVHKDASSYHEDEDSTELSPFMLFILKDPTADVLNLPQAEAHGCCVSLQGPRGGAELLPPQCAVLWRSHQAKVFITVHDSENRIDLMQNFNTK